MTEAIATFEKVRDAVDYIRNIRGLTPTVTLVRQHIGGGSRSTILPHMQKLFGDVAKEKQSNDIAEVLLTRIAAEMVKSLWKEASTMATAEMADRIKMLSTINDGIADGMRELVEENEALEDRALAAETRVATLETELKRQKELEDHLNTLSALVHRLQDEPLDPTMFEIMQILSQLPQPPDREELHRRLLARGHENDRARGARHKVVKDGYVEEKGRIPTLHLTEKGMARLAKADAEVANRDAGAA